MMEGYWICGMRPLRLRGSNLCFKDPSHMLGPAAELKEGSEFLRGSSF